MTDDRTASPYTLLAQGYDTVMAHVDYGVWAEYIYEILLHHYPGADDILELGCGTGSLALVLQRLGGYRFCATDLSEEMLGVARGKARKARVPLTFAHVDFRSISAEEQYDAILLLYDGINYVTEPSEISSVLSGVHDALRPGGLFIFDQSTPTNSLNHSDGFDDAGTRGAFRYLRTSRYDPESRLHTTLFRLDVGGETRTEKHIQRAYRLDEMRAIIETSPLAWEASYDGFSLDAASEGSERIHHVLRRSGRG